MTPPQRRFKKNAPDWYELMHERWRKHTHRDVSVSNTASHTKHWRALTRHLGCREYMSNTVQAIAGLLSHQQTADLNVTRQM